MEFLRCQNILDVAKWVEEKAANQTVIDHFTATYDEMVKVFDLLGETVEWHLTSGSFFNKNKRELTNTMLMYANLGELEDGRLMRPGILFKLDAEERIVQVLYKDPFMPIGNPTPMQ